MKALDQKMRRKLLRKTVSDEVMKNAEIYDLALLWTLHEKCGYGAVRLRRFYADFVETYQVMRERYFCKGDEEIFGSRTDAYVIKRMLKDIGFDYDKEVKELADDARKETD